MPPEAWQPLALLGAAVVALVGVLVGHRVASRNAANAAAQAAAALEKSSEQILIDQLQEELTDHRAAQESRMTAQESRMTDLESRNHELMKERDGYRDHAHELRSHIWDGNPPPPPDWPEGLPR